MSRLDLAAFLLATGCSAGAPVLPAEQAAVEAFLRADQGPLRVEPVALWHATDQPGSLLCGEIAAPAALQRYRKTLRYVYDTSGRKPFGTVERHELVVGSDAATQAVLVENRTIFDNIWVDHCLPSAPVTRRVAAWFAGSNEAPPQTTPLTNAHLDNLLGR